MIDLGFSWRRQKSSALWVVKPWGQVEIHRCFGVISCLRLHRESTSQAISKNEVVWGALDSAFLGLCFLPWRWWHVFLWNIIELLLDCVKSDPRICLYDIYLYWIDRLTFWLGEVCVRRREGLLCGSCQPPNNLQWSPPGICHRREGTCTGLSSEVRWLYDGPTGAAWSRPGRQGGSHNRGKHRHRCVRWRLTSLHSFRITGLLGFLHHLIFWTEHSISEIGCLFCDEKIERHLCHVWNIFQVGSLSSCNYIVRKFLNSTFSIMDTKISIPEISLNTRLFFLNTAYSEYWHTHEMFWIDYIKVEKPSMICVIYCYQNPLGLMCIYLLLLAVLCHLCWLVRPLLAWIEWNRHLVNVAAQRKRVKGI